MQRSNYYLYTIEVDLHIKSSEFRGDALGLVGKALDSRLASSGFDSLNHVIKSRCFTFFVSDWMHGSAR